MAGSGAYGLTSGGAAPQRATGGTPHNSFTAGGRPPARPAQARPAQARPQRPAAPRPTNPLAPLSPKQIRGQASKTVGAAYGSQFQDLNNQSTQAQNLYKTQTADDAAFNQWLTTSSQALQAQTDDVNSKLLGVYQASQQSSANALNAMPGQQAAAIGGGASSQNDLNAAAQRLEAPAITAANAKGAEEVGNIATTALSGNNLMAGAQQVAQARISQAKAGEFDTLNKTLNAIGQERTKLLTARTGDIAKEIARLQGVEISKAQYNQNQSALDQKLGIQQQSANATTANAQTNAANAKTRALQAQETARHNAAMEGITKTHYANQAQHDAAVQKETARHNAATEALGLSKLAAAGGTAGKPAKPATPAQQATWRAKLGTVQQMLTWDINQYHKGDPQALSKAYHDLLNGNFMAARYGKRDANGVWHPGPRVAVNQDVGLINAATNTLTQYGAQGLTPGDVAWLEQQGLSNVGGYYPVKGAANQGLGAH